jgi:hypothetical protein
MKTKHLLLTVLLAAGTSALQAGDSKRTAEYILTTPTEFEGKEVTLDVAFVKPVHWKSPAPELAFFHAITMDRGDKKPGGGILVAIPAADAAKFAKKFGTDFDGRNDMDTLRGTLVAAPGKRMKGRAWLIDTTGMVLELVKDNKLEIEEEGAGGAGGPGPHRPMN